MAASDCGTFERWLVLSLEGALAPRRERRLRAHLEGCPACRALLSRYASLRHELAALEPEPLPVGGLPDLPRAPARLLSLPVRLSAAVSLAALIVVAVAVGSLSQRRQDPPRASSLHHFSPAIFLSSDWHWVTFFDQNIVPADAPVLPELDDYYLLDHLAEEDQRVFVELLASL